MIPRPHEPSLPPGSLPPPNASPLAGKLDFPASADPAAVGGDRRPGARVGSELPPSPPRTHGGVGGHGPDGSAGRLDGLEPPPIQGVSGQRVPRLPSNGSSRRPVRRPGIRSAGRGLRALGSSYPGRQCAGGLWSEAFPMEVRPTSSRCSPGMIAGQGLQLPGVHETSFRRYNGS